MNQSIRRMFALCILLLLGGISLGVSAQTLSAATDLKESQSADSKTLKNLPANTPVKLVKREGFWVEVEAAGAKGWVKLSTVNMGAQSPGLNPMDTGRSGKGNIVSTSAARGLSAKDLTLAKPDPTQFAELQKLAVSRADADKFAKSGGLNTRQIALLAASPKPAEASKPKSPPAKKPKKSDDDDDDD
jgi:hypothetical protein